MRSELIALLISILSSLLFLGAFALLSEPEPVNVIASSTTVTTPVHAPVPQAMEPSDRHEKFRSVPENFVNVDFANRQYEGYEFQGRKLDLTLVDGKQTVAREEAGGGETFSLVGVLYTDVSGDGKPEAVVNINHVQCGGSCDGGSDLFYIYQSSKSGLKRIWMYETGSMAYGCGLKSFSLAKKQIVLEMFGQCWKPASSFEGPGKFMVRDTTRSVFHFNGKRFVKRLTEVTAAPVRDLKSYTPEVHINE